MNDAPQIQIYKREHDDQWQVCCWVPSGNGEFRRERRTYATFEACVHYLITRFSGLK